MIERKRKTAEEKNEEEKEEVEDVP